MTQHLASVDESVRSGRYLLACVVVDASTAGRTRRDIRKLLLPNERRLHIRKADRPQRLRILSAISEWDTEPSVYVYRTKVGVDAEAARQRLLGVLVADLQASGIPATLYIERREGADDRDRETIIRTRTRQTPLDFHHLRPVDDPLLWLPDCVAWAIGAGREWRDALGDVVRVIEPT